MTKSHFEKDSLPEDDPIGLPPNESKDTKIELSDHFKVTIKMFHKCFSVILTKKRCSREF